MAYWLTRYADMDSGIYALATEFKPVVEQGRIIIHGEYIEFFPPEAEDILDVPDLKFSEVRKIKRIKIELEVKP